MRLRGFPRYTLRAERVIYRIHKSGRSPWWFSANGDGRFDPVGTDFGACYLAGAPLGAWIEVFRKRMLLAEAEVDTRCLQAVALGRDLRLADATSRRALQYGITASIGGSEHYEESQAFSAEVLAAGYDGIRYLIRHDPAQRLYGITLFGPPGRTRRNDPLWPCASGRVPDALVREAHKRFGYRVLPEP